MMPTGIACYTEKKDSSGNRIMVIATVESSWGSGTAIILVKNTNQF